MNHALSRVRTLHTVAVAAFAAVSLSAQAKELPIDLSIDAPSPKAVVVALHGIQTNASWFEPLGRELARQGISLRAVNIPRRGMAHPPAADAESWSADWVQPLQNTAKKVHAQTRLPVLLLGTSWGARPVLLAATGASEGTDWCRGVVLVAPALKTSADVSFLLRANLARWTGLGRSTRKFRLPLRPGHYTKNDAIKQEWLMNTPGTAGERQVTRATYRHFRETKAMRGKLKETAMAQVKVPVLALFGKDDTLVDRDKSVSQLEATKGPRKVEDIPGGTHAMQLDKAPALASMISNWRKQPAHSPSRR
jgi:alpha-beta hydrolase superfamily lysophospholipase